MEDNKITLCYTYYNQPKMLRYQLNQWSSFGNDIKEQLKFIIVDDGSKVSPLEAQSGFSGLDLKAYQIHQDIGWNNGGAKNLAVYHAKTDWVLVSDIDHVLDEKNIQSLLQLHRDDTHYYIFNRFYVSRNKLVKPAVNIFLVNKEKFWNAKGYDEDFSGFYGYEDCLMRAKLNNHATERLVEDITLKVIDVPDGVDDANKSNEFKADLERNRKLLFLKLNGKIPLSTNILRFDWSEIKSAPPEDNGALDEKATADRIESVLSKFTAPIIHNKRLGEIFHASMRQTPGLRGPYRTPDALEILTCHNYNEKSLFEKSLDYVGIRNYTVLHQEIDGPWRNTLKLKWVLDHLESNPDGPENVLFCDADDCILIDDPGKILDLFNRKNCQLLFMSTSFMGGYACMPDIKRWSDRIRFGRYLNSGVYIGKREFLITVLQEASKYITDNDITEEEYRQLGRGVYNTNLCERLSEFPKGCQDQDILRYLHPHFFPHMQIDYDSALAFRNI